MQCSTLACLVFKTTNVVMAAAERLPEVSCAIFGSEFLLLAQVEMSR